MEKQISGSKGAEGREFINLLFKLESEMKDYNYEEKKEKHQEASRVILDAFWSWIEETSVIPTTNEKLTRLLYMPKTKESIWKRFMTCRTILYIAQGQKDYLTLTNGQSIEPKP